MVHQSEINFKLDLVKKPILDLMDSDALNKFDVIFVRLPNIDKTKVKTPCSKEVFKDSDVHSMCNVVRFIGSQLKTSSKLLIMGDPHVLPYIHSFLDGQFRFHYWIAVRLSPDSINGKFLKNEHLGVLLYTKDGHELNHSTTRIAYEYCKYCNKTTKDYGGRKHLYHSYGTSISDVWKDIAISKQEEFPQQIIERIRNLFSVTPNKTMVATSLWNLPKKLFKIMDKSVPESTFPQIDKMKLKQSQARSIKNKLIIGDAIAEVTKIDDNTIDMIFVDPPYNLSKKYDGYSDRLSKEEYFTWCDKWLDELSRVLKLGGSLFVLNIPSSAIRYFLYLQQKLHFQNWIVWDSLSVPLKLMMPAHYSILYFTKGSTPKTFNYHGVLENKNKIKNNEYCEPLDYGFCIRKNCLEKRKSNGVNTSKELTDLWSDIHRVKHNSLREDHPTLLPPKLLKRLISLSSKDKELILDCFNGVGTTTLIAQQLGRNYLGIEINPNYHETAAKRHNALEKGEDPFEKKKIIPKAKNTTVARVKVRTYEVPKKILQLEVKDISKRIGRLPTRDDVIKESKYPIKYFDTYFKSWTEVLAAARTTGMSENKPIEVN